MQNTLPLALGGNLGYAIVKLIFAFSLGFAIFETSKLKKSKLIQ